MDVMFVNGVDVDRNELLALKFVSPVRTQSQGMHFSKKIVAERRRSSAEVEVMDVMCHVHCSVVERRPWRLSQKMQRAWNLLSQNKP